MKKKPVSVIEHAHGVGNWIYSVAAVPYADIVASGSKGVRGFLYVNK